MCLLASKAEPAGYVPRCLHPTPEMRKVPDAELDKLVAEMNSASADKKLDAIASVLTKPVEQRKAMHEQMQKMMSANDKEGTGMCRMMGWDHDGKHSHHPLIERF
jgi:hypothetical protein